jgi:amino acid transporter
VATGKQLRLGDSREILAESRGYAIKRRLLGPPLVTEQLSEERLSKPLALGVLSCDGISSAAYGSEEILIELVQVLGYTAAFAVLLPMTAIVLFGIAIVVLLYREVVSVYTRAGGSYVVARENFGPRIAQVAAVALLIDYVVTVAVQTAAGSAAIVSAFPSLSGDLGLTDKELLLGISVLAVLIMCYGNLRGIREAGRSFALPTYLFSGAVGLMIAVGVAREISGTLHPVVGHLGRYCNGCHGHPGSTLLNFVVVFALARAFANGGSSLTGIEAVSNAVSALRPPEGRNARQVLVMQGSIVAFLIAGISWLAHVMHVVPYTSGVPTVLAQEAGTVFGQGALGRVFFYAVQAGTAAILFTGGNTSFSGFPFLASFVAEDSFLPRWLTKRGHRLVFSNGIILLAVVSLSLLLVFGATVNGLVPLYAIGVFTGFSMAGFGMARYHHRTRGRNWRRHRAISLIGGVYTALVVLIFAIVKFTEGAWVVVVLAPILVFVLIRVNRQYRMEANVLEHIGARPGPPPTPPTYARRTVYVFVDEFDLATLAALRYARSLRPTSLRAVHFVLDSAQAARLREDWLRANTGVALDFVDCPDRRIARCAGEMVQAEALLPGVGVTAVLPRRTYSPLIGRLLHDRTGDQIAGVVSQIPHAAATIVPFDVRTRVESLAARAHDKAAAERAAGPDGAARPGAEPDRSGPEGGPGHGAGREERRLDADADKAARSRALAEAVAEAEAETAGGASQLRSGDEGRPDESGGDPDILADGGETLAPVQGLPSPPGVGSDPADGEAVAKYNRPVPSKQATPIGRLPKRGKAIVEGRVHAVEIRPVEHNTVLACEVVDATGQLTAMFYGRSHIPGLDPGAKVRLMGQVGVRNREAVMINPAYELLAPGTGESTPS